MPPRKRKASDPLIVPGGFKWMRRANGPLVAVNLHLHAPDEPQPDYVAASLSQALEVSNSGGSSPKRSSRRLQPCFPPRPDEEHYWDNYYLAQLPTTITTLPSPMHQPAVSTSIFINYSTIYQN